MNKYEVACKQFLRGCTCAPKDKQEECKECLTAFCNHLRDLQQEEKDSECLNSEVN